jgi:hypothetical protein
VRAVAAGTPSAKGARVEAEQFLAGGQVLFLGRDRADGPRR